MRRVREFFQGLRDLQRNWSFGRDEYQDAVRTRKGLQAEIKRVELLRSEVQDAHNQVPGALSKIRQEVELMGEQNRSQLDMIDEIRKKNMTPEEIKKMVVKMEKSGTKVPNLGPLYKVMDTVKNVKD